MLRPVVLLLCLAGTAVGGWSVEVVATVPGLGVEEVETAVAVPLEKACAGVAGVWRTTAHVTAGRVRLEFDLHDKADRDKVRQQVQERLQAVELPAGAEPPRLATLPPFREPAFYVALGGDVPRAALGRLAERLVVPALREIPGVAGVDLIGAARPEVRVYVDPARLAARNLDVVAVAEAVERDRGKAGFAGAETLGNLDVAPARDFPVFLRDVATVEDTRATRGRAWWNGRDVALVGVRVAEPADVGRVRAALARARTRLRETLPMWASLDRVMDRLGSDAALRPSRVYEAAVAADERLLARLPKAGLVVSPADRTRTQVYLFGEADPVVEKPFAALEPTWLDRPAAFRAPFTWLVPDADLAFAGVKDQAGPAYPPRGEAVARVVPDRDRLAQAGIPLPRLARGLTLATGGERFATKVGGEACDVVVRLPHDPNPGPPAVLLQGADGKLVELKTVARIEQTDEPSALLRVDGRRVWAVPMTGEADALQRQLRGVVAAAKRPPAFPTRLWPADGRTPLAVEP